jgi:hypothetical protein
MLVGFAFFLFSLGGVDSVQYRCINFVSALSARDSCVMPASGHCHLCCYVPRLRVGQSAIVQLLMLFGTSIGLSLLGS